MIYFQMYTKTDNIFHAAAPASCCHARHRGHIVAYFAVTLVMFEG